MSPKETPLSPLAKAVLWFVAVNALAGAAALMLFPTRTNILFFWTIVPPINAALFGALYLAGAFATAQAALRGRWETARFLIPVLVTAGILLSLTTFLHLDRFVPGPRLAYWLVVYMGAPLIAVGLYLQYERRGATWQVVGEPVQPATRALALATGALIGVAGVAGLVLTDLVTAASPWSISPLMARVFASWFTAFAPGLLWFGPERDWSRLYPVANLMIMTSVLDLLMIGIHRNDLVAGVPSLWLVVTGLIAVGVVGVLMLWSQRYQRAAERSPRVLKA